MQTGMCPSHLIRSSWASFPKCDWLYADIYQMAIYSDKLSTLWIPRKHTRLVSKVPSSSIPYITSLSHLATRIRYSNIQIIRWSDRNNDSSRQTGEMSVGLCLRSWTMLCYDRHHVGASEKSEAFSPVCRNILAS